MTGMYWRYGRPAEFYNIAFICISKPIDTEEVDIVDTQ